MSIEKLSIEDANPEEVYKTIVRVGSKLNEVIEAHNQLEAKYENHFHGYENAIEGSYEHTSFPIEDSK